MKKISKLLSAAAVTLIAVIVSAVTAFAADDDICLFEGEKRANGIWGQAFSLNIRSDDKYENLILMLNENSKIYVDYSLEGTPPANTSGVEFILQKWEKEGGDQIWAQVPPISASDGVAVFDRASLVKVLGTDDLSVVDQIYVGDTGAVLKVTKIVFDIRGDGVSGETADVPEIGETINIYPTEGSAAEDTAADTAASSDDNKAEETIAAADDSENEESKTAVSADETDSEDHEESKPVNVQAIIVAVIIAVTLIAAVIIVTVVRAREKYY